MKLVYILWSLVILVIIIFIPGLFYRTNAKLGGGPDLVAYYLLLWIATSVISPLIIVLKKIRVVKRNIEFIQTLLAVFNFYFGAYGIFLLLSGQVLRPGPFLLLFCILNLIWAILLTIAIFRKHRKSPHS
jgi:hypothetical protein